MSKLDTCPSTPKLLVILPARSQGGVEAHALTVGAAAAARGWAVEAAFPKCAKTQALITAFAAAGVQYRVLGIGETVVMGAQTLSALIRTVPQRLLAWVEKPLHLLLVLICLVRSRPDVVMINLPWGDQAFTSLLACALLNQPTAVVFHLIPWRLSLPRWKQRLYRWIGDRAQTWIGISDSNRQLVSESFRKPKEQIVRIYNGTDVSHRRLEKCDRTLLRQRLRQRLNLPDNAIVVLTVARLSAQKGHDYLIPAIPHLVKQFPLLHFVWVGEGDRRMALEKSLADYGIQTAVSLLGHCETVSDWLQAADLFVLPTHFEGLPFALLEAMAQRLPVVAANVNGIPELIEHRRHGLLTRPGDSCDLLEALRWALAHPEEMAQMAARASQKAQQFSTERMVSETLTQLEKIAPFLTAVPLQISE